MSDELKPEVTRRGALDMQVCVPREWTDAEVLEFASHENFCGTEHGWQIRREGDKALGGDPERARCNGRPTYCHIMLDA